MSSLCSTVPLNARTSVSTTLRSVARVLRPLAVAAGAVFATCAHAATFEVLHRFVHSEGGFWPGGTLVVDAQGDLYGTTTGAHLNDMQMARGALFKLHGTTLTTLRYFQGGPTDGAEPYGSLIIDKKGVLYGTTSAGGTSDMGTVYRYDAANGFQIVHSFTGVNGEGASPFSGLSQDVNGVLFGTTPYGGDPNCGGGYIAGCGTIYKLRPHNNKFTTVHTFQMGQGIFPDGAPTVTANHLWTTTTDDSPGANYGGAPAALRKNGKSFHRVDTVGAYGFNSGLTTPDDQGNLYGVFSASAQAWGSPGGGIYRLSSTGQYELLYSFPLDGTMGSNPSGTLVRDTAGMLYGVTKYGGTYNGSKSESGTIFKFNPTTRKLETLYSFPGGCGLNGCWPLGLTIDSQGTLYGMTIAGGYDQYGVIYRIKP